jgi:hypothetical protein
MDSLNIKVTITIALLLLGWPSLIRADDTSKYAVYFTDKPPVNFDPFSYFDKKAIERRILHALPLYDWYDLPVAKQTSTASADCLLLKRLSLWERLKPLFQQCLLQQKNPMTVPCS